ncbi:hypothetical protein K431DRAFT_74980 [Polychaeton citri CBS 116435]|uniref:Secreted protein n=1 Tax=Polychaeton citri CBS 116435 TaxID=1314669 RepID=A0A9P4UPW0_9PEZI|nr:hypothetical protein K431DRAFT_74980 [Polychaeton citri CBS 116435]
MPCRAMHVMLCCALSMSIPIPFCKRRMQQPRKLGGREVSSAWIVLSIPPYSRPSPDSLQQPSWNGGFTDWVCSEGDERVYRALLITARHLLERAGDGVDTCQA